MAEETIKKKALKLSLIGDAQTGKTSIINRFVDNEFNINMVSTTGIDKKEVSMKMKDDNEIKLIIWDTAGQERFNSISSTMVKNCHGIIICFAINNIESFKNVINWLQDVREISRNIPVVLFGNKCDLIDERKISNTGAKEFAAINEMIYFETSAKDNINIKEGFEKLAESAYAIEFSEKEINTKILKDNKKKNKKNCC